MRKRFSEGTNPFTFINTHNSNTSRNTLSLHCQWSMIKPGTHWNLHNCTTASYLTHNGKEKRFL